MADSLTVPKGLNLIPGPNETIIRKVWLTWMLAPLALFAVLWDAFLFFWYSHAFTDAKTPWIALLLPIGLIAVGIGLTYFVLVSFVNRTDMIISSEGVRVSIGPAPWVGNKVVSADQMVDIRIRVRSGGKGKRICSVLYVDHAGKERKLVTSLTEYDQAEFITGMIRQTVRSVTK